MKLSCFLTVRLNKKILENITGGSRAHPERTLTCIIFELARFIGVDCVECALW